MLSKHDLNEIHLLDADEISEIYGGAVADFAQQVAISEQSKEISKISSVHRQGVIAQDHNWSTSLQSVLDQPPVSLPQRLILGGIVFSVAFGAWANFGQIDEIGHAKGQLIPQGEVYKIHPTETGKVVNIAVKEGERVKTGQLLAELDPQMAKSEIERLEKMLASYQVQLGQTQNISDRTRLEVQTFRDISAADVNAKKAEIAGVKANMTGVRSSIELMQADVVAQQARKQRLEPLQGKTQELLAQLEVDAGSQQRRKQWLEPLKGQVQQLLTQLRSEAAAHQERVDRLKPLVAEGALSKEILFQAEQSLRESQNAIIRALMTDETQAKERLFEMDQAKRDRQNAIVKAQLADETQVKERLFEVEQSLRDRTAAITKASGQLIEQSAQIQNLEAQLTQKAAQARQNQLEKEQKIQQLQLETTQMQAKIGETKTLLGEAKAKLKQRFLYAPVDGAISSLNLRNSGEVVQVGQTIAEIAPENAPLILHAILPNREAGFAKVGMPVQVKFDAFPYQEYGMVSGKVISISPDAKPDEKLGAVYRVEVALDRNSVTANNQTIQFKSGQTASADIVIRSRRVIDVLLDPIKQLQKGGISL